MLAEGDTVIELPVPAEAPPQDPVNHWAVAPVPAEPPLNVNVVDAPSQIVVVPIIPVGAVLFELTVIESELAVDVPQELVAVTERVPLELGVKVTPVVVLVAAPPPE